MANSPQWARQKATEDLVTTFHVTKNGIKGQITKQAEEKRQRKVAQAVGVAKNAAAKRAQMQQLFVQSAAEAHAAKEMVDEVAREVHFERAVASGQIKRTPYHKKVQRGLEKVMNAHATVVDFFNGGK